MVSKCANPSCVAAFTHREGRLFCFPQAPGDGGPANSHSVRHYWLCGSCFQSNWLHYDEQLGVAITRPFEKAPSRWPRKIPAVA